MKAEKSSATREGNKSGSPDKGEEYDGKFGPVLEQLKAKVEDAIGENFVALVNAEVQQAMEGLRSNHEGEQIVVSPQCGACMPRNKTTGI